MSDTNEIPFETSSQVSERFQNAMDRMFVLREFIPEATAQLYLDEAKYSMHCGLLNLLEDVYYDMRAMSDAYWELARCHRKNLIEQGKIADPQVDFDRIDTDKATGTDG